MERTIAVAGTPASAVSHGDVIWAIAAVSSGSGEQLSAATGPMVAVQPTTNVQPAVLTAAAVVDASGVPATARDDAGVRPVATTEPATTAAGRPHSTIVAEVNGVRLEHASGLQLCEQ